MKILKFLLLCMIAIPLQVYGESVKRDYSWRFGGKSWWLSLTMDTDDYAFFKERTRYRDYDLFASDPFDDEFITDIVNSIESSAKKHNTSKSELPYLIISFVQSMPYTEDSVSSGFDEFPRYPYETLYDNGGDCEDTAILVAALLYEMGYDVVLLKLPLHIAVGIRGKNVSGTYFKHDGKKYYYLETTGKHWKLGKVPDEYKNAVPEIVRIQPRPYVILETESQYKFNHRDVTLSMQVKATNLGTVVARNFFVDARIEQQDSTEVWDRKQSKRVNLEPEESRTFLFEGLKAFSTETYRISVAGFAKGYKTDSLIGDWVLLKNKAPYLELTYGYTLRYNSTDTYVDVDLTVSNTGTLNAENVQARVELILGTKQKVTEKTIFLGDIAIDQSCRAEVKELHLPGGRKFKIAVEASAGNFKGDLLISEWITEPAAISD
ncbi:MAG: hypothetical protein K8S56_09930 [Candidatus Cloacimonetes bacterium]|nr:hypothetical protein [Candidatus Cloacimonadota bacterium]